jgi:ribosomal protein L40E
MNPLLSWLKKQNLDPYSGYSPLVGRVCNSRWYLGDIATDKRKCHYKTLKRIEKETDGEVSVQAMTQWWEQQEQGFVA